MNTSPRLRLQIDLPAKLSIRGHIWTMVHEDVDAIVRQALIGPTLRHTPGAHWIELGVGIAERAEAVRPGVGDEPIDALDLGLGTIEPALFGGLGTSVSVGEHMQLEVALRGAMSIGAGQEDVYHAGLVISLRWQ